MLSSATKIMHNAVIITSLKHLIFFKQTLADWIYFLELGLSGFVLVIVNVF